MRTTQRGFSGSGRLPFDAPRAAETLETRPGQLVEQAQHT